MKIYLIVVTQLFLFFSDYERFVDKYFVYRDLNLGDIVVFENRINNIPLPFPKKEMLKDLKEGFGNCAVEKYFDFDPLDGGEYYIYSISYNGRLVGEFEMSEIDSLQLSIFSSNSLLVKDQYGVKVGDFLDKVKGLRIGKFNISHNYWQGSQITFENSNILYEIIGETEHNENSSRPPSPIDPEMKDWKVSKIVWKLADY